MGDDKILTKVAVGDVVANELKYHSSCLIGFCRKFYSLVECPEDTVT